MNSHVKLVFFILITPNDENMKKSA